MQAWRSDKGFSLVEVMVVVAIIGLMTSAVVLTMPSRDDKLADTLSRTGRLMTALERHAVMTGQVMGVHFSDGGLEVLQLSDDGWHLTDAVIKAGATTFDGARLMALAVDGAAVDPLDDTLRAHVYFLPTGEKPAFTLSLLEGGHSGALTISSNGPFEVQIDG